MIFGAATVKSRLDQYGAAARSRLRTGFIDAGVAYPPAAVTLLAVKADRVLHVYAGDASDRQRWIASRPIRGMSGMDGPKLRSGDGQVPEGVYGIESLNPNSRFHLSLRVSYPDDFDRLMAARDGRTDLGGDIMIHGGSASVGCLAMGDEAAEELFTLAADTGIDRVKIILTPVDLRLKPAPAEVVRRLGWSAELYEQILAALRILPPAPAVQAPGKQAFAAVHRRYTIGHGERPHT